jgi:hypothetical protein
LERRRKKLDELRKSREQKKTEAARKEDVIRGATPDKSVNQRSREREDVDRLVSDLIGGSPVPPQTSPTPPGHTPSSAATPPTSDAVTTAKRKVKLVKEPLAPIIIRPKEVEVYVKATQTDMVSMETLRNDDEDEDISDVVVQTVSSSSATAPSEPEKDKNQSRPVTMEMSPEQRDRIIASDGFMTFFDRASRLVERALCEPSDILFDYVSGSMEEGRDALGSLKVVRKKVFVDERWSQNRNVTAIDWSSYVSACFLWPLLLMHTSPSAP